MFSDSTLNLLSSKALAAASNALTGLALSLATKLSASKAREQRLNGFTEVTSTTGGKQTVVLTKFVNTAQKSLEQAAGMASTAALAKTLLDGGQLPYNPLSLPEGVSQGAEEINLMNAEVEAELGVTASQDLKSKSLDLQKANLTAETGALRGQLDAATTTLEGVNAIISKRATGELPNPELNYQNVTEALESMLDDLTGLYTEEEMRELRRGLTNAANSNIDYFERYVLNRIIVPFEANTNAMDIIASQLNPDKTPVHCPPIFDTVFGPPVSYRGKFILSNDGLYYDSRTGGIPYIAAMKINAGSWELRYASNRGGKGELYQQDRASRLSDTVFDDEYKNESGSVLDFYKYDDVLRGLRNDRDLRVQDVSGKIDDLIVSGYATSSAIVKNYMESYAAIGFEADSKIKKRKKQLQVAALFGPFGVTDDAYGKGPGIFYRLNSPQTQFIDEDGCGAFVSGIQTCADIFQYANSGLEVQGSTRTTAGSKVEYIDRIPINDFTYLKEIGMVPELYSQKSAMLHSSDLDETTNPIAPVYLEKGPGAAIDTIPESSIAPLGILDWVNTSGDTDLTGTVAYIRTLDDSIVDRDLVVCYNFLEPSGVVTSPSSNIYGVRNYARTGTGLDAKMVGSHASSIFISGVSIPFLEGSLYKPGEKYGIRYSHMPTGSYVRLPNNYRDNQPFRASQPIDDLMYNSNGWTFDFWTYVPTLSALTDEHRYRLILANENSGETTLPPTHVSANALVTALVPNNNDLPCDRQGGRTKGMLIGFRDRGNPEVPAESSGLQFVVLPTVSQNHPRWGKSVCIAETVSGAGQGAACHTELGFKVDATVTSLSGYTVSSCVSGFTHYALTCDLSANAISLYVNGQFLASSTVSNSFETIAGQPLNVPSRVSKGFFQGDGANGEQLIEGHVIPGVLLTPWILGGGYTDGISHEIPPIFSSTFPGFLGTNTNDDYFVQGVVDVSGGPVGQHSDLNPFHPVPGLGGYSPVGTSYEIPSSGLGGHIGSFKMYKSPLTIEEVNINYNAQRPFFTGIKVPHRLL